MNAHHTRRHGQGIQEYTVASAFSRFVTRPTIPSSVSGITAIAGAMYIVIVSGSHCLLHQRQFITGICDFEAGRLSLTLPGCHRPARHGFTA